MLLGGKQNDIKQVAIVTRNEKFNRVLGSILADWRFFTVEKPSDARVVFVERGLAAPATEGEIVWLTPMPLAEGRFLKVPLSLTSLYHLLEVHFFPTPRRHIRVAMETAVDLQFDNRWLEGCLISLSDRGGRIICNVEIPRGTLLTWEASFAGKAVRMQSEVLYCIPAGDSPGRKKPQVGLIFRPQDEKDILSLRNYIEKITVKAGCAREGIPFNDPCISWIDIAEDPWV